MSYELDRLSAGELTGDELRQRIERLIHVDRPRLRRLWAYYRNPMRPLAVDGDESGANRPYRQAQEWGLPSRITGIRAGTEPGAGVTVDGVARKEVVIENDIGWRIDTLVDYLAGKPVVMHSTAADAQRRATLTALINAILQHNGGTLFLQQLALMSAVYGFVDVLVKFDPAADAATASAPPANREPRLAAAQAPDDAGTAPDDASTTEAGATTPSPDAQLQRIARTIRLEIVEPARALPLLSPVNWRVVRAYAQVYDMPRAAAPNGAARSSWRDLLRRSARRLLGASIAPEGADDRALVTEIITAARWQRYEDERLVADGDNALGEIPLVHIQNTAVPFEYSGTSDVEPLIPLQDELNTRLSDRASRIALQSFKMYLGKGIDHFVDMPVAPGRMWQTDNEQADVITFGGDDSCPSEQSHITEIREAIDKVSAVTPIAAGAIKERIGRLTSAAALRITLLALLSKTDKKRSAIGAALERMMELSFAWLERAGLFATTPDERGIELHWPSPLPENDVEKLQEARMKADLGVPKEVVLRELGY